MRRFQFAIIALLIALGFWWNTPKTRITQIQSTPATIPNPAKAAALAARLQYLNHPMTITGKTLDGSDFSSSQFLGKVILIHFWASWCPDCNAELPALLKTYNTYHAQGLEVVAISSDVTAQDLTDYLKTKPEISWTQLYTPPLPNGRHPLNTTYHVDWIPTLFLLDKSGTCRSINADENLPTLIPQLLAEKQ